MIWICWWRGESTRRWDRPDHRNLSWRGAGSVWSIRRRLVWCWWGCWTGAVAIITSRWLILQYYPSYYFCLDVLKTYTQRINMNRRIQFFFLSFPPYNLNPINSSIKIIPLSSPLLQLPESPPPTPHSPNPQHPSADAHSKTSLNTSSYQHHHLSSTPMVSLSMWSETPLLELTSLSFVWNLQMSLKL